MAFLAIIGIIVVSILSTLLNGFVFQTLWGWFIVPFGITPLGLAHAIGVALVIRFLTYQYDAQSDKADAFANGVLYAIVAPLIALLMGWIVHSFI